MHTGGYVRGNPQYAEPMFDTRENLRNRLMDAIDLVVDIATLGEYGIEPLEAVDAPCAGGRCEQDGRKTAWEALVTPRRGSRCEAAPRTTRVRG
jgi:hypothetical protein